jgi:hypothetical protein
LAMPLNGQQSLGLSSAPSVSSSAAATYEEPATTQTLHSEKEGDRGTRR